MGTNDDDTGDPKAEAATTGASKPEAPKSDPPKREVQKPELSKPRIVTSMDPRLESIEPLIGKGDWEQIAKDLGPPDAAGRLPPNLGLIYAIAQNEREAGAAGAHELAIRCAAGMFGVPPESAIALILAKRLMRRMPMAFRQRPAPPARVSLIIILLTLVIGGGVGWILSSGSSFHIPIFHK